MGTKVILLGRICFPYLIYSVAKGNFYLLDVQIRLLTRWKILDVASFLYCLQIIFSLSHTALPLNLIWISSANWFKDYNFTVWIIINLLTKAMPFAGDKRSPSPILGQWHVINCTCIAIFFLICSCSCVVQTNMHEMWPQGPWCWV